MAKITPESIADLKALFQDNEKALGANFSQLIDFFNNNKVTDNGDGTFTVGTVTVDASKLYDLINNSSPNILPLDNEFTGKNTFDIAPINKANGKPYITEDSVPPVDLSNYATQQQLATKADDSKVVHTADLLGGRNYAIGAKSLTVTDNGSGNNYPSSLTFMISPDVWGKNVTISYTASISGFTGLAGNDPNAYVDLKMFAALGGNYGSRGTTGTITKDGDYPVVWKGYIGDFVSGGQPQGSFRTNLNSGAKITISNLMIELGAVQHDWVPALEDIADTMASKTDVTTAISTATANMVDSTKATNFTAGLQSGGVNVATAADLKSVADSAWRQLDNKYITTSSGTIMYGTYVLYRLDTANKRLLFMSTLNVSPANLTVTVDFRSVVNNISTPTLPSFFNLFMQNTSLHDDSATVSGNLLNIVLSNGGGYASSAYSRYTENGTSQYNFCFVNYDELV